MPTTTVLAGFHAPPAPGENPAVRALLFDAEDFYFRRRPSDFGVSFRRWIDDDSMEEVSRVLAEGEPAAFRLLGRLIDAASLNLSSSDVSREERHLREREKTPEHRARSQFLRALWNGHPYGRESSGDDVSRVVESDLEAWVRRVHSPRAGVLVVVGDVEPDAIFKQAGAALGGWKPPVGEAADPPPPPALRTQGALRVIAVEKPGAPAAALHFGCLLPPAQDEAALVRDELVADAVEDYLWGALRIRASASYAMSTRAYHLRGGAAFLESRIDVDAAALPVATATIGALTNPASPPPFDGAKLERMRWAAARRSNLRYGNSDALAGALFDRWNMGWGIETLDEYPARLAEVTLDDVTRTFAACRANAVLTVVADGASSVR